MPRLILYEINTRCWLRALSLREGRAIRLGEVPETDFAYWSKIGVTHLWLMGVWSTGPISRQTYLNLAHTATQLENVLPDWTPADVTASPYAISSYTVPDQFGGETGLASFRRRLKAYNIRLILDYVPNHLGLDHPWLAERPELFAQSTHFSDGLFRSDAENSERWIAHGKDPYFPPWLDTAQLDFRLEATQRAQIEELRCIANRCDGVRCDMAMLALKDVFEANWRHLHPEGQTTAAEFWSRATDAVKHDDFLFIAEAYWDLEPRLLELGFDFTYDKRVTDYVIADQWTELRAHLRHRGESFIRHSVHFLENHDEPRIASRLTPDRHASAAFLMGVLPGMWLIQDGQLRGARAHAPVQLARLPEEPDDPETVELYEELFDALHRAAVGQAGATLSFANTGIAVHWKVSEDRHVVAVINGGTPPMKCVFDLPFIRVPNKKWNLRSLFVKASPAAINPTVVDDKLTALLPGRGFDLIEFLDTK